MIYSIIGICILIFLILIIGFYFRNKQIGAIIIFILALFLYFLIINLGKDIAEKKINKPLVTEIINYKK